MTSNSDALHVFVGVPESHEVAARVLEHTIRRRTNQPVVCHWITCADLELAPGIEFEDETSLLKFAVPRVAKEKLGHSPARVLYLSAAAIVFGDIADLLEIPFGDACILCAHHQEVPNAMDEAHVFQPGDQPDVLLIDCTRVNWAVTDIVEECRSNSCAADDMLLQGKLGSIQHGIPSSWNCVESFEPGQSKLVNYRFESMHPWANERNNLKDLWQGAFREAMQFNAVPIRQLEIGMTNGQLKKSLLNFVREDVERIGDGIDEMSELAHVRLTLWDSWRNAESLRRKTQELLDENNSLSREVDRLERKRTRLKRAIKSVTGVLKRKKAA